MGAKSEYKSIANENEIVLRYHEAKQLLEWQIEQSNQDLESVCWVFSRSQISSGDQLTRAEVNNLVLTLVESAKKIEQFANKLNIIVNSKSLKSDSAQKTIESYAIVQEKYHLIRNNIHQELERLSRFSEMQKPGIRLETSASSKALGDGWSSVEMIKTFITVAIATGIIMFFIDPSPIRAFLTVVGTAGASVVVSLFSKVTNPNASQAV